jgi:hypothetical protein
MKKSVVMALAGFLFLLACARAGDVVFSPPASESTPIPTPAPTPTPTPTPDPYREMEKIFFPVLEEIRKVPGNENARVAWDSGVSAISTAYIAVQYRIEGVTRLRLPLSLGRYSEGQVGPWLIRYVFYPPEWRVQIGCTVGYSKICEIEDGYLITDKSVFFFMIESNEEWWITLPRWTGPPPPGLSPSLQDKGPLR